MIKNEFYRKREDGTNLYKIYSDTNKFIREIETGIEYSVSIDVADKTYEETDKDIEIIEDMTETELKAQAYDILTGEVE